MADSYFSNVSLLLHCEGANGSTTFADNSPTPKTVTANGNAQISTAQSKWGNGSALFDGNGDYLSIPHDAGFDFGTGDFTVEAWVRLANVNAYQFLIGTDISGYFMLAFNYPAGGVGFGRHNITWDAQFSSHGMSNNTWHHIAITRSVTNCRCFVDGNQIGTTQTSSANLLTTALYVAQHGGNYLNGHIQDFRITKGFARYTANFTAPEARFGYSDIIQRLMTISNYGIYSDIVTHSDGIQLRHGFVNRTSSTLAFDNSTHIFTLGVATTATIFINGVAYTITAPGLTIDLDTKTLSNGLWFIWIEVSAGDAVLNSSKTPWSITSLTEIPCATVYWNGAAGALCEERHGADRNLPDHLWKHLTVGARIQNDGSFAQTYPTTAVDAKIQLIAGYLWDEDIANAISTAQGKLVRNWYETAAAVWTFADGTDNAGNDRPYIWNAATSRLRYPDTDVSYALTDSANDKYIPVWVYASNDMTRPIYLVTPSLSVGYGTVAQARAALQPNLPFAPELKLLWRWIFRGDGEYQEAADYRTSSSLPGGGVTSPSALTVSFAPTGDIAALNVQAAIEELDTEKLAITALAAPGAIGGTTPAAGSFTTLTANGLTFPATQSASADANTLDDYEEGTWTATLTSAGGSITPGSTGASYTKVGRTVTVSAYCAASSVSSPTGELIISGLPFTHANAAWTVCSVRSYNMNASAATQVQAFISANSTVINVRTFAAGVESVAALIIKADSELIVTATYYV